MVDILYLVSVSVLSVFLVIFLNENARHQGWIKGFKDCTKLYDNHDTSGIEEEIKR